MKRLNLVLFGVFLLNFSVFAQIGGTTQRGKATHEMNVEGLLAAHNSFPIGSLIKVVNPVNGKSIDAIVSGRIPATLDRVVDLSHEAWVALGLTEGAMVMLVYTPPPVTRPSPAAAEPAVEITEQNEAARLKAAQRLYHLLILDRRHCEEDSDISDLRNIELLYKFSHGENGYLVVLYASTNNGPVFPVMPDKSRILVNLISTDLAFIKDYTNSAPFKRFVINKHAVSELQNVLK